MTPKRKRERERERTWHSGGEGDCVNRARGSDPSFFLVPLEAIMIRFPSLRRQTCLFLKGCVLKDRKGEKVNYRQTVLSLGRL